MSNFLPNDYEVPSTSGQYMKFIQGENKFRILASPIVGNEYWIIEKGGKRKPIRVRMGSPITTGDLEDSDGDSIKHFWAMPVYNYKEKRIQVLELTQKGLQKQIKALSSDGDWGSPTGYDLVITRFGESLETTYILQPKPAKAMDPEITSLWKDVESKGFNLDALFDGNDPFTGDPVKKDEETAETNIDDIPLG